MSQILMILTLITLGQESLADAEAFRWMTTVHGKGSAGTKATAEYKTEAELNEEISRERARCHAEEGKFRVREGYMSCRKIGQLYQCESSADCYCDPLPDGELSDGEDYFDAPSPVFASRQDCRAIVLKNPGLCAGVDCRGVLYNLQSWCRSNDCRAIVRNTSSLCQTKDCRAIIFNNLGFCESENCRAIILGNLGFCR